MMNGVASATIVVVQSWFKRGLRVALSGGVAGYGLRTGGIQL